MPRLLSNELMSDARKLFFECTRTQYSEGHYFDVEWIVNGRKVMSEKNIPTKRFDQDSILKVDDSWGLPLRVNCSWRARSIKDGVPSSPVISEEFFAGIRILTPDPSFRIQEGQHMTIQFKSTIPVPCVKTLNNRPYVKSCEINFENSMDIGKRGCNHPDLANVNLESNCGFRFNGRYWDSPQEMKLVAFSNGVTENSNIPAVIRLRTSKIELFPLWSNYALPEIQVITEDANQKALSHFCQGFTDVHYTTFDRTDFEHNEPGWYLMYRHTEKPLEVMTINEAGGHGDGSSQCAVSVKAASDVFIIYLCNNSPLIVKRLGCQDAEILEVYERESGKKYMVVFPTGTRVEIKVRPWSGYNLLNIIIYPSPDDIGKTEGLCGNFDGRADSTFSPHINLYRLGDRVDSEAFTRGVSSELQQTQLVCFCPKAQFTSIMLNNVQCNWKTGVTCPKEAWNGDPCHTRMKRDSHLEEDLNDWVFDSRTSTEVGKKRVRRNTWTLTSARAKCLEVFRQHASFNKCAELPEVALDSVATFCAKDVVASGKTDWIPAALEVIKSQCMNVLDVDSKLWQPKVPGTKSKGDLIFEEAKCPRECNGHGTCFKRVCQCVSGYVEEDCSVDITVPPTVKTLSRGGVCNLINSTCKATHVYGTNFYNSPGLKCRLTEIIIDESGVKTDTHSSVMNAKFENFAQVTCVLPDNHNITLTHGKVGVHGYYVEISNNGAAYSNTLTFMATDPTCHECDTNSMTCKLKVDSCFIDGACYTTGAVKSGDLHLKCMPSNNRFAWTTDNIHTTNISYNIRLAGGSSSLEGRVELFHNGAWGTICNAWFTQEDARVICRMLGFSDRSGSSVQLNHYGGGTGPIWFYDADCFGTEQDIRECPRYTGIVKWGISNSFCSHERDAGVRCTPQDPQPIAIG